MNRALPLCLVVFASSLSFAQTQEVKEEALSPATRNYRAYRLQDTEPTFGIKKVKTLVSQLRGGKDEDNGRLSVAVFNRLTTAEKFTYCMIHGEDSSQNCDGMPWVIDEQKKAFGYLPGLFGDNAVWSQRQSDFLVSHRSEVIRLIRSTMLSQKRVGVNLKATICRINAYELIPDLVKVYSRDHRDQDILTVFMQLMKSGEYAPFLKSATYHKLYGENANYQAFIEANAANQKLMVDRVMAFYRSQAR